MRNLPLLDSPNAPAKQSEYGHLATIVRIGFPVRAARIYLSRQLGNPIQLKLVEVQRGEEIGKIRAAEVHSYDGGPTVHVSVSRTLPDGSPASLFTPREMIRINTLVYTDDNSPVPALRSKDKIVLHVPVRSYLRFLPGIYRGSSPTVRKDLTVYDARQRRQLTMKNEVLSKTTVNETEQFRRFMLLFQHVMTTVIDKIDDIANLTDPLRVNPSFLPWLSSWVNFHLDASLPLHQQRELIRRSIKLQRMRGTNAGVSEMVRILTSSPVKIIERTKPNSCGLGRMTLSGGKAIDGRFLRREPPGSYLVSPSRQNMAFFVIKLESMKAFHKRFGERATDIIRQITQIVTREMPAHVVFTIQFEDEISST